MTYIGVKNFKLVVDAREIARNRFGLDKMTHVSDIERKCVGSQVNGEIVAATKSHI